MGKKEQVPARAIFVQGSLWVWSATSRGRPPDGGLALAVFHMVPRVPAAPNLFVHPPADLRKVLLPPSSRSARLLGLGALGVQSVTSTSRAEEQTRRARRGREQDVAEISRRMYDEIRSSRDPRDHVEDG